MTEFDEKIKYFLNKRQELKDEIVLFCKKFEGQRIVHTSGDHGGKEGTITKLVFDKDNFWIHANIFKELDGGEDQEFEGWWHTWEGSGVAFYHVRDEMYKNYEGWKFKE